MGVFFSHISNSFRGHLQNLTCFLCLGLLLSFMSCQGDDEPNLTNSESFELFALNESVCPGMQVQLHLFDKEEGKEIDFSDFVFDPIPNGLGEISAEGIYQAPNLISGNSTLIIKMKRKNNPRITAGYQLELTTGSDTNLSSKIPHQFTELFNFYGLSSSNEFLFGSPPIGTGPAKSERYVAYLFNPEGQTVWAYDLGIGSTQFGMVYNDYFLISGGLMNPEGDYRIASKIYDGNGNELKKEIQEKIMFRDYYLNQSNELFLSNSHHPNYAVPTQIFKLSSDVEILGNTPVYRPIHSFMVEDTGSVIGYYLIESSQKSGVVKVNSDGVEEWNISLPYSYPFDAKLVQLDNQNYGLVKAECKTIPCRPEIVFYEFGVNGEVINPGQTIVSGTSLIEMMDTPIDDLESFFPEVSEDMIQEILVVDDEVLFVFYASTKNYNAIMIKGTQGSSLEYWWDKKLKEEASMTHVKLSKKDGGLEWKTLCGKAICTFQLDENLAFDSCF